MITTLHRLTRVILVSAASVLLLVSPATTQSTDVTSLGEERIHPVLVDRGQTVEDFLLEPHRGATDVDPGVAPEGDYLGWMAFTPDGERVLATNRGTDNVTVFDWSTKDVLANVDVGTYPSGIATTTDYAIVACSFSDEVYVIDLTDYSIDAVLPTGEQPWVVRVSQDGNYAFVSCDIDDVCEVIDLTTLTHVRTITGFPVYLRTYSFGSENGRNSVEFTNFEVVPGGVHLVVGDWDTQVLFFNWMTGAVDYSLAIPSVLSVSISGDGNVAVALSGTNPAQVHQISLNTFTLVNSVTLTGLQLSGSYTAAVNGDGFKAFTGVTGNQSAIIRFATSDFITISSTYTPFWVGVSPDHSLAISGQYRFSIVDFATESLLGQHQGNSQSYGAVSPSGSRAVGGDPLRHEGVYFYRYLNPMTPTYRGTTDIGEEPEGDCPRRVAITPDGAKAVVTNVLSDNATILNLETLSVEAVLDMGDRVQNVAITSDSRYAVVCCWESATVKVIDLGTNTVVAEPTAGSRAGVISITPDDQYAYVGNISANTVSVIELDGAASSEVTEFYCGVIGVTYAAYTVSSDVEASPGGRDILVAASFDDQVKVIDTSTHTIVASLPTGDFPLQIAYRSSGDYATVTDYLGDTYTVMRIDGASSSVVGTFNFPSQDGPLRLAYNRVTDQMGIGYYTSKTIMYVDPQTGAFQGSEGYSAYGALIQLEFDPFTGESVVLTGSSGDVPGHLHRAGELFELPASPSYFDYVAWDGGDWARAVVTMPGPDWVTVIEWAPTGVAEMETIPLSAPATLAAPIPNPFRQETTIGFSLAKDEHVRLDVFDVHGRRVANLEDRRFSQGDHQLVWDGAASNGERVAPGVYFVKMRAGSCDLTKRVTCLR